MPGPSEPSPHDYRSARPMLGWVVGLGATATVMQVLAQLDLQTDGPAWASALDGLVGFASIVVAAVWLYRIAANADVLGARTRQWPRFWAVVAWAIPIANWILPFLVTRELWKTTSPDKADWTQEAVPALFLPWWILWVGSSLSSILFGFLDLIADLPDLIEQIRTGATPDPTPGAFTIIGGWVSVGLKVLALPLWIWIARGLQTRQDRRHAWLVGQEPRPDRTPAGP